MAIERATLSSDRRLMKCKMLVFIDKIIIDLLVDPHQILMVTVAAALRTIGCKIEVLLSTHGPVFSSWRTIGVPVNILDAKNKTDITVEWLNYDGILVKSLAPKGVELFKSVVPYLLYGVSMKKLLLIEYEDTYGVEKLK
ncbi:hypothetical protein LXL04_037493 [Taraxacum kok-saghyz]